MVHSRRILRHPLWSRASSHSPLRFTSTSDAEAPSGIAARVQISQGPSRETCLPQHP